MTLLESEYFWLTVGGVLVTLTGLCLKSLYKCKFSDASLLWGCCVFKRDTVSEQTLEQQRIENGDQGSNGTPQDDIPTPSLRGRANFLRL
jgi:hypothetical protein